MISVPHRGFSETVLLISILHSQETLASVRRGGGGGQQTTASFAPLTSNLSDTLFTISSFPADKSFPGLSSALHVRKLHFCMPSSDDSEFLEQKQLYLYSSDLLTKCELHDSLQKDWPESILTLP